MRSLLAIVLAAGLVMLVPLLLDPQPTDPVGPRIEGRVHPQGGRYRCPVPGIQNLNPLTQNESVSERYVLRFTHDTLFDRDPITGDLRPNAATKATREGRSVTFELREGLRFSDGSLLELADLEFLVAISRHERLQPRSASASKLQQAELVETSALDDRLQLKVTFPTWSRSTFERFATAVRLVQRSHFVEAARALNSSAELMSDQFVDLCSQIRNSGPGTGPYLAPGDGTPATIGTFAMLPNPHSWHRVARPDAWNLDAIELRFVSDSSITTTAAIRGDADFLVSSDTELDRLVERHQVLRDEFVRLSLEADHLGTIYLAWNQTNAPLDDRRVREALEHIVDRQHIAESLYGARAVAGHGYYRAPDREARPFEVSRARKMLEELGRTPTEQAPLRLVYARGTPIGNAVQVALNDDFDDLGWPLQIEAVDDGQIGKIIDDGDFDIAVIYSEFATPRDPFEAFHSTRNRHGLNDPDLDRVLVSLRTESEPASIRSLFQEFENRLHDSAAITPICRPTLSLLLHKRFQNVEPGPLGLVPERWWVSPDQQRG
ncbi:MAG: ABC transporter substrate-binding protein [Planctomycetota bacterium]